MQAPRSGHFQAALHALRYIRNDPSLGLFFSSEQSFQILSYCDADWASCSDTRRSVSGFFLTMGNCPISWKSKKQQVADIFTKGLGGPLHWHFLGKLGVRSPGSHLRGGVEDEASE
ncbi:PREDICTED: uncharacterized protein LOC109207043, partial [Nicotiana attenuata]|uniref:uncharacterized protein LOC109207043 n=1 Tax=Nicotiana attenuata TaxID=49451 RepID=UPI0009057BFA